MKFRNNLETENKLDYLIIDNGENCIKFNLWQAEVDLKNCDIPEKVIEEMTRRVKEFKKEVEKGNEERVHYGSSDLSESINSLFYTEKDLGFNTETERKLAAMVFKRNCEQEDKKNDELEIGEVKSRDSKDDELEIGEITDRTSDDDLEIGEVKRKDIPHRGSRPLESELRPYK